MSWQWIAREVNGFDAQSLQELLEEALSGPRLGDLDHDLRELCGGWTILLEDSPRGRSIQEMRAGRSARSVARDLARDLARMHRLVVALEAFFAEAPLPPREDPAVLEAHLEALLGRCWKRIERAGQETDLLADALLWYLESQGVRQSREVEEDLAERLLLEGPQGIGGVATELALILATEA